MHTSLNVFLNKVRDLNKLDSEYSGTNLFDIEDIEHYCLRNDRACSADRLSEVNIVISVEFLYVIQPFPSFCSKKPRPK